MPVKPLFISPSILSADFTRLGAQILEAESGGADWLHVDVMDGHFVPNLTMGPFIVEACRRVTALPLDVHLMIQHPEDYLKAFAEAGASNLTVHVETCQDLPGIIEHIHALGCQAGVTLNPDTPVSSLATALPSADLVLVMTVHPGYSGQQFMENQLPKIAALRRILDQAGSAARLEVDGGISAVNITRVLASGADTIVAATAVFKHPQGIAAGIATLRVKQDTSTPF
jgi:ribulose-phosphate 3-epimerase